MRRTLPSSRNRRLAALIALATLVAAASFGLPALADTQQPAQAHQR
jgi:hypothetical protein